MFDNSHYVPLLRAKLAELGALGALRPEVRRNITPIIEVLPRNLSQCTTTADVERVLENLAADLAGSKGLRLFLDLSPLDWDCHRLRDLSHPLERLSELLTRSGVQPVPVITLKMDRSLSYGNRIKAVLKRFKTDLCLRITPGELSLSNGCENLVSECLNEFGVTPAHIDLVLDRCAVDSSSRAFSDLGPLIPYLDSWKTFTVLAGSFPENLEDLTRGDVHHLRRFEWLHWRAIAATWSHRRPAFGDYGIQHVYFKEPVPVPNYSASVRYTLDEHFLVLRGEGVLNPGGPGHRQYNGWAQYLLDMPDYFGRTFSAGDGYAAVMAESSTGTGNATTWLQMGFSHHLTLSSWQACGALEEERFKHQHVAISSDAATTQDQPPASR